MGNVFVFFDFIFFINIMEREVKIRIKMFKVKVVKVLFIKNFIYIINENRFGRFCYYIYVYIRKYIYGINIIKE